MSQEADLNGLRNELTAIQQQTRRSRRWALMGFLILVLALGITNVYGFVQQVEATRQREMAMHQREIAEGRAEQADKNAEEALRQRHIADQAMSQLEEGRKGKK